jgi:hypothetical protein
MPSNDFFFKFYMFIIKVFTRNKIKYVTETPNKPWSYGSVLFVEETGVPGEHSTLANVIT